MPPPPRLDDLFELVRNRFPDRTAVVDAAEELTYAQLGDRADRLAAELVGRGAGQGGGLIGLAAKPGLNLIVGILAILKAGGSYLVIDPAYPSARIAYILRDSKPKIILAADDMLAKVGGFGASIVALTSWRKRESRSPVRVDGGPDDPAYVIYTSGTTGNPNAVVVEHAQVTRLFGSTQSWFGFTERDVWTLFHSASFDFSVWEIWGALLHGGALVVVPPLARRHPAGLLDLMARHGVTVLNQTPSAFRNLLAVLEQSPDAVPASLRLVVFGGERLDVETVGPFLHRHPGVELVNMYGITETTVHVTYRPITAADLAEPAISPIGVPIPDLSVDLYGSDGELVPDGTPGEMWISGAGLARGYLNRPELTAARFVTDASGRRAYRSGDRAVRRDGELVHLGRIDDQLKVNGFRIEPGEIEAVLRRHPDIADVVVTAGSDGLGGTELVALVVLSSAAGGPVDELAMDWSRHLQNHLPAHLRPSRFHPVAGLQLTQNGKVDRKAAAVLATQSVLPSMHH
jgi:amino acid adenylation domain-containing protein